MSGLVARTGPDYGCEIRRVRRIALVVDQLEAVLLDLVACTGGGALREFGVGCKDGYCLWLRLLCCGHVKKANRERIDALRPTDTIEKYFG
jgi:hypothetical protein